MLREDLVVNKTFLDQVEALGIQHSFNKPLAPFTSYKIGGPAEVLIVAEKIETIKQVYELSHEYKIPFTILGGGSNILISDSGIRGVVVINKAKEITVLGDITSQLTNQLSADERDQYNIWVEPRHGETGNDFYTFADLDYNEEGDTKFVQFDSGVVVSYAIAWGLKNQLTGLQWFAGIPGTIGGALYNNIHGGSKHFSDNFVQATILDEQGIREVGRDFFEFGYDQSALRQKSNTVVLTVTLQLYSQSDVEKAKYVAQEWARRKRIQPRVSSGCIFQNITKEDQLRLGFVSPSIGYIVDKQLGWAGKKSGGAMISDKHAAFIENTGDAQAVDVLALIRSIKDEMKDRFGITLHPEINLLGFSQDELKSIVE